MVEIDKVIIQADLLNIKLIRNSSWFRNEWM